MTICWIQNLSNGRINSVHLALVGVCFPITRDNLTLLIIMPNQRNHSQRAVASCCATFCVATSRCDGAVFSRLRRSYWLNHMACNVSLNESLKPTKYSHCMESCYEPKQSEFMGRVISWVHHTRSMGVSALGYMTCSLQNLSAVCLSTVL